MLALLLIVTMLLVLAALAQDRRGRRLFTDGEPAFVCRIRTCGRGRAPWRRLRPRRWSRHMWARWEAESLVVRRGPVFDRTVRLAARAQSGVYLLPDGSPRPYETRPIAVRLAVDGAVLVEVAALEHARMRLVGPYLAAAANDLPKAPVPRRET